MNFLTSPNLTERHIVKCSYDAFNTYLFQLGKSYLVFLAKPSPCSFHKTLSS